MHEEPEQPQRRTALATTTPADLVRIAVEQNADLDKIAKLMDLQDRWEAKQARNAFIEAMSAFKAEPIEILKNKRVHFESQKGTTDYKHAELSDVCDAVVPALAKHGLSHRWDVKQTDGQIVVTCVLTHMAGHSESLTLSSGADQSGNKNSIQAIGSAATYLSRYTLLLITGLATKGVKDDDGKGAGPTQQYITEGELETLNSLIEEVKAERSVFLEYLGVESLEKLPAANYRLAALALQSKRKAKKETAK
jgi:hypothetical protein